LYTNNISAAFCVSAGLGQMLSAKHSILIALIFSESIAWKYSKFITNLVVF